jgi:hypothetical protein
MLSCTPAYWYREQLQITTTKSVHAAVAAVRIEEIVIMKFTKTKTHID